MKTANLLSLSVVVVLTGLATAVGCSSPTSGAIGNNTGADTSKNKGGDDDDSTTTKKKTTSSSSSSSGATTSSSSSSSGATTNNACQTCLSANAKAVAFVKCDSQCKDQTCDDKCMSDSGCETDQACTQTLDKCDTACGAGGAGASSSSSGGTDPGTSSACTTCLGGATSPAAKYVACSDKCQDQNCDDKCFNDNCGGQEQSCDSSLQKCDTQCNGGQ